VSEIETRLGIIDQQIAKMQMCVTKLERANDSIGNTPIRHAISQRLVEIRLLLRDGDLKKLNGGRL
jgi:hypothetical protein